MTAPAGVLVRLPITAALIFTPLAFSMASENTVLVKSLLLGLCAAATAVVLRRGNPVLSSRFAPLNALILLAAAHTAVSPSKSFAVSSLVPLVTLWIMAAGGAAFPASRLKWIIPFALLIPAAIGALQIAGMDPSPWQAIVDGHFHGRICATLGNPNFFAAFIAAALPFCAWGFAESPRIGARIAFGFVFCLGLVDLFFTGSKGGMIGAAVSGVVFAAAVRRVKAGVFPLRYAAAAVAVAAAAFIFLPSETRSRLLFLSPEEAIQQGAAAIQTNESVRFRQLTWAQTMRMSREAPVLGHGLGRFQAVYPRWRLPEIITMFGQHSYMTDHPENISLEILAETGVLGLGMWIWLAIILARSAWAGRGWFEAAAAASLAGLLATNSVGVDAHYGATAPLAVIIGAILLSRGGSEVSVTLPIHAGAASRIAVLAGAVLFLAWARIAASDMFMARAIAYSRHVEWDLAAKDYRSARVLNPFNVMNRYFEASALLDRGRPGDLEEAERLFTAVRAEAPDYVLLNYKLSLLYNRLGRKDEAKAALDRQIELDPVAAVFYLDRGRAAVEDGRQEDARREFETAIRVEPDNPSGYQFLGNLLVLEKRYGEAMNVYGRGLMKNPGSVELHYNAAVAAFRMGDKKQAELHALAVLERDPGNAQAKLILEKIR